MSMESYGMETIEGRPSKKINKRNWRELKWWKKEWMSEKRMMKNE